MRRHYPKGLTNGSISFTRRPACGAGLSPPPHFSIQLHRIGAALFVGPVWQVARAILDTAVKNVAHHAAARVSELRPELSRSRRRDVDERLVRRILMTRSEICWLDDAGEWFWLRLAPRNRLLARVRKVLAVRPRIHVSKLHEAISRARPCR